jgi:hypothetical protein
MITLKQTRSGSQALPVLVQPGTLWTSIPRVSVEYQVSEATVIEDSKRRSALTAINAVLVLARSMAHEGKSAEVAKVLTLADHDFISHARQDVPKLLGEVDRLRHELGR